MKTTYFFHILCASIVAAGACDGNGERNIDSLLYGIINGQETQYQSWQSVIYVRSAGIRCSGTLIHERLVLTAGHCVKLNDDVEERRYDYDYTETPWLVEIWGGANGEQFLAGAERIVHHPDWDGDPDLASADIALILLDSEIEDVKPSSFRDFPPPEVGENGVIVGYGLNLYPQQGGGVHRVGETTILYIDRYFLEIGGETNTCSGDSGGPLFTDQGGEWVVTGVTSFGMEECPVESDGYEINLLSYCDWLNRTMSSLVGRDMGLEHCTACSPQPTESWGDPCGPGYPCCGGGTVCRFPADFSQGALGYCAPACCEIGSESVGQCSDVGSGVERCSFTDTLGESYCAIHCESNDDCRPGTTCKNKPFESERICVATSPGPGETIPCDTELPSDTGSETVGKGGGCSCRTAASSETRASIGAFAKALFILTDG